MVESEKKATFIQLYSDFITHLGLHMNSTAWWSTWLASRDAFSSAANPIFEAIYLNQTVPEGPRLTQFISAAYSMIKTAIKIALKLIINGVHFQHDVKRMASSVKQDPIQVIKTFAFNNSFKNGRFLDPYFGHLSSFIQIERQIQTITICDVIGDARMVQGYDNVLSLQAFMRWWDAPLAMMGVVFSFLSLRFPQNLYFAGTDVTKFVRRLYQLDLISRDALYSRCVGYAMSRVVRTFNVRNVIMTCENHPWERMAILAIRVARPKVRITSYQHSVVHEALLNMYPGKGEVEFAPVADRLLTVGEETAKLIKKYGHYGKIPVEPACALRFEYFQDMSNRKTVSRSRILLVVLSGIPRGDELLDYVLEQLPRMPDWNIIIREHPALTIADLEYRRGCSFNLDDYKNVEVSRQRTVLEDLDRAGATLYHSSSVALEALQMGVPIIHYNDQHLLSMDPAQFCNYLHWEVKAGSDLRQTLEMVMGMNLSELASQAQGAKIFVSKYFKKCTSESLDQFIS